MRCSVEVRDDGIYFLGGRGEYEARMRRAGKDVSCEKVNMCQRGELLLLLHAGSFQVALLFQFPSFTLAREPLNIKIR